MSHTPKPLILVDGSSYLYRAYHALPSLTNSQGCPTGAIYGMVNMLKRLLSDYQPESMAVIFDAKGKTFRDEIYADYKATRERMPDELSQQIPPLHAIIRAMGLPLLMVDGVEADDVIGTIAVNLHQQGCPILISTGDKDLAQLVNPTVTLVNTMTNTILDEAGVEAKFGVRPNQMIDYLTLVGDTSDHVPGVPHVGPKTAAKWLQAYGSLDNLISHADQLAGKVGDNFRAFIHTQLPLTRTLVTIKTDVPLNLTLMDLKITPADDAALIDLFKTMEFKTWLAALLKTSAQPLAGEHRRDYQIITTKADFEHYLAALSQAEAIVIDTETTSLDYMQARLVGLSFAIQEGQGVYIPLGHDYPDAPKQLPAKEVLSALKPLLENAAIPKIGQNLKYDIEILANQGIHLSGIFADTMLASYVLDSASSTHNMDALSLKYLGIRTITFTDIAGKGSKQKTFNQIDLPTAGIYAAEDADITLRLYHHLYPKVCQTPGLHQVFQQIEMPLVPILANIERTGVLIDPQALRQQSVELAERIHTLEQQAFDLVGTTFNLNSPKQLQDILFNQLNLPVLQKTPTGQASTADEVLQELALDFSIARIIIEYRSLSKLMSTYTLRLVEQIDPTTQRIHTSYNQAGTGTGRLSSSEPNLQNIPVRTPEGRRIRQAFIAKPGYQLISADYSQIELRLIAHLSEDPTLLQAFSQHKDIHQATAAEVWGVSLEEVTPTMRRDAKAINFGLLYGMSAFGLARQLGIDRKAAQAYIDRYFARYPNVRAYMDNTRLKAKEMGYVETLWGRRLYIPNLNASQIQRQKAAERAAINAPLQGSAADIIKLAMIHIANWLDETGLDARMIMQVHDELVFEVNNDCLNATISGVAQAMTTIANLRVPLVVSVGHGQNWDAASAH